MDRSRSHSSRKSRSNLFVFHILGHQSKDSRKGKSKDKSEKGKVRGIIIKYR